MIVGNALGEILLLQYMLGQANNPGLKMHLYDNYNSAPQRSDGLTTYSQYEPNLIASDTAYKTTTLLGGGWTISSVDGVASAYYSTQLFTLSKANSVQGYYVTDSGSDNLLWAERFNTGPINVPPGGGQVLVNPTISLQ